MSETPEFPVKFGGVDVLQAAFFDESRTRPGFPAVLHGKEPRVRLSVKKGA